jgi:hypothetical protein
MATNIQIIAAEATDVLIIDAEAADATVTLPKADRKLARIYSRASPLVVHAKSAGCIIERGAPGPQESRILRKLAKGECLELAVVPQDKDSPGADGLAWLVVS